MMYYYCIIIFSCLCLMGCKSAPKKDMSPKPQEFVNIPMTVAGTTIPGDSQEKYLINPRVRSYAVGRMVSKDGTMHEQHSVYRVIADPKWNMIPQPNASPAVMAQKRYEQRYALTMLGQLNRVLNELKEVESRINMALSKDNQSKAVILEAEKNMDNLRKRQKIIADNVKHLSDFFKLLNTKVDKNSDKLDAKKSNPVTRWKK